MDSMLRRIIADMDYEEDTIAFIGGLVERRRALGSAWTSVDPGTW